VLAKMKKLFFAFVCLLLSIPCAGKIVIVDCNGFGDFINIQDAIDDPGTENDDTIVVLTGTYNENINFNGLAITLTGEDPDDPNVVQATIITADTGYSVTFDSNEEPNSVLTGFTITVRGILCRNSRPMISKNIIRDCDDKGIRGQFSPAPVISGNTIIFNNIGIAYCNGDIIDNIFQQNSANYGGGLYWCDANIVGNVFIDNFATSDGGALFTCGSIISGNIIVGNESGGKGGGLFNCSGIIHNNIIAGNISGKGGGLYNCGADIYNNTIVGNIADNQGGALNLCNGLVYNNIIAFNQAADGGGTFEVYNNFYNDFWENGTDYSGGSSKGPGDINENPLFAVEGHWDDNGTPGTGDDFWVDGDYHLLSQAGRWNPNSKTWTVDIEHSPCIDAGDPNSDWTEELWPHGEWINMGVYGGATQASMSLSNKNNVANLTDEPEPNDWVDYYDLKLFTDKWLCEVDRFPLAEDLDRDGVVDFVDFSIFGVLLRPEPPKPPTPDPMEWETPPYATSPFSIAMTAATATSSDGNEAEYYFECTSGGGHDSDWQDESNYTDTGLIAETEYSYKVQARDKSNLLKTGWSDVNSVTTLIDFTAPEPNPAQWQVEPYASPFPSISMEAVEASDPSGVEYYFECTNCIVHNPGDPNDPNLYSSDWQDDTEYEVTDLPEGVYSFVVRARDKSPRYNTTGDSNEVTVDVKPPTPDPMQWAPGGEPKKVDHGGINNWWAEMKAVEATDENGVEYKFVCANDSRYSSGGAGDPDGPEWRNEDNVSGDPREYEVDLGQSSSYFAFYVVARDRSVNHNKTGKSSTLEWE